jgi:hypothetical protein
MQSCSRDDVEHLCVLAFQPSGEFVVVSVYAFIFVAAVGKRVPTIALTPLA